MKSILTTLKLSSADKNLLGAIKQKTGSKSNSEFCVNELKKVSNNNPNNRFFL